MTSTEEPAGRAASPLGADEPAGTRNGEHTADVPPGLAEELARAATLLRAKALLSVQRARLTVQRTAWLTGLLLWAALALVVATVIAVPMLLRGMAAAIASWTHSNWAGDLGASVLFFGGAAIAVTAIAARRRRAQLRRLQEKFGP